MASYKKLAQLIAENKDELCGKLEGLLLPSDTEKIKQLCVEYVSKLTRKDAEYMNQLSLLEQDILSPVLKVMDTMYSSDIELSHKANTFMSKEKERGLCGNKQKVTKKSFSKEYGPALAGAAGGTMLATICKPSSWGVILFGSVVSVIIGKVLYSLYVERNEAVISAVDYSRSNYPEYRLTHEDSYSIVKGLESAGDCIDKVLLTYRSHLDILEDEYLHKLNAYNLDKKYIGVLECYQAVLGNMFFLETSPIVTDTIKQVTHSLSSQGYKAIHYSEEQKNLFEVKYGDCGNPDEFKPAIVKLREGEDVLILKGEVVLPNEK